jgi:hypothetical protein
MKRTNRTRPFLSWAAGIAAIAAVTGLSAGPANAQASTFVWSGDVDNTARVEIRGRSVNSYAVDGKSPRNVNYRVGGAAFEPGSSIRLQMVDGRGDARIIQYPDRRNNYTTIVEIRDDRYAGADRYEFRLVSNGGGYGNGSNGRWDDRDDRWDNDRWNNGRWNDRDRNGNGRWDNDRDNNGRWGNGNGNGNSSAEREAYQLGFELGKRDRVARMSRQYDRYRARYNSRTQDEFRRGYNNGYDDASYRR